MQDGSEAQRIEVELTASAPEDRAGRRPTAVSGAADPEVGSGGGILATEVGRLVAVGAFAAVVALSIGVLVGRMGSGNVETADDVPTSTIDTTTAPTGPDSGDVGDTLPPAPRVLSPTPTTPATTTTAVPGGREQLVKGTIEIDPAVPVAPVEVVALTGAGQMIRIDVATGTTVEAAVGNTRFGGPPSSLFAGDGWVVVPSFDGSNWSTVIHDDGSRAQVDLGDPWSLLADPGRGTFWVADMGTDGGAPARLVETTVEGTATGAEIGLDGFYPQMLDPLGGVVVQAPGGQYSLTPDAVTRLTAGRLLGLGSEVMVTQECSESLTCAYTVIDRTTGASNSIDLQPPLDEPGTTIEGVGWWNLRETMSPTGDALLVFSWRPGVGMINAHGVLDLTTGRFEEIGAITDEPTFVWAPDGRAVYWIDQGTLKVFDRTTGESVPFSEELGRVTAVALRPSLPSVDATDPTVAPGPATSPPPSGPPTSVEAG